MRSLTAALLSAIFLTVPVRADDWPQWLGPQRDGVWREDGIQDRFPPGGPKLRWRLPLGGGYAGPAVADGKVYVTDRQLPQGGVTPTDPNFKRNGFDGKERVLCLDEATGKVVWTHEYPCRYDISYPCGPRTTPVIAGGKVYTLGAMGDLFCLDAASGKVLWSKNFPRDYRAKVPLWGCSAHPLLDGDKLICLVGAPDGVVMAFHKDTGKELWRSLRLTGGQTEIGYCPPVIFKVGNTRQLIIWHPESVNGLEPENGQIFWSEKFKVKANMTIANPRLEGNLLLVTSFYNGAMLLRLNTDKPGAEVVWKGKGRGETPEQTDTLHSIMPAPLIKDGHIYGVCSYGELRCLRLSDGGRVWEDLHATGHADKPTERWANAFLIPQGDRFFLFNEKGDLIIARLSPKGYEEIDRAHLLDPTGPLADRKVLWSHPAFADRCIFARNDKEIVCYSLKKGD